MKQYLRQWIAWLIMVGGVCLLSGPFILGAIGEYRQQNVVHQFEQELVQNVEINKVTAETRDRSAIVQDFKAEEKTENEPAEQNETPVQQDSETEDEHALETEGNEPEEVETAVKPDEETTQLERFYYDAVEYNDSLIGNSLMGMNSRDDLEYFPLRAYKYGIKDDLIGVVTIPRLEIELGLYLGATEYNMIRGLAVFGQTSVPLGRPGENCSIAGHRGYNGTPMLRDIQQLMPDDPIYIKTLWGDLEYRVCELRIVTPEDNTWCAIDESRTLITLMTCHPYGRNYQRYIVFAELCEPDTTGEETGASSENDELINSETGIKLIERLKNWITSFTDEDSKKNHNDAKELLAIQPVTLVNADGSRETIEIDTTAISPGAEEYGTGVSNLVIMAEDKMLPVAIGAAIFVGFVGIWLTIQTVRGIRADKKKKQRRRSKGENNASE